MERPPDDARDERGEPPVANDELAPGEADRPERIDRPDEPEPGRADLLSIALLVFFVSLIGVVGALLLLPVFL